MLLYKSKETNHVLKGAQTMTKGLPQTVTENGIIYRLDNATQTYLPDWELPEQKPIDEDMQKIAELDLGHSEIVDHGSPEFIKGLNSWKV